MKHLLQHFKTLTKHPQNAEELKGLILQLAIQGKLTENWRQENPNVEPASNLLEQIKEQKKVLIAEKKIKKVKSLPTIEDYEKPYELPEGWVWCRFQDIIIDIKGGGTPSKRNPLFWDGDLPWASVKDLKDFRYLVKTQDFITEAGLNGSSANLIPANSLIICTRMGLGKIAINKIDVTINQDLKAVRLTNFTDIEFIYDQYKTKSIQGSGMTVSGIKQDELLAFLFAIPPLEEQKAIVEIVNELFKEVEQLEEQTKTRIQLKEDFVTSALQRLTQTDNINQEWQFLQTHFTEFFTEKENVKQLRETILQLAVHGKLTRIWRARHPELVEGSNHASELLKRIQTEKAALIAQKKIKKEKPLPPIENHEKPYDLPEGWVWCRMGEISGKLGAGSTPSGGKSAYVEDGIKFFRSQNIYNDYLKLEQVAYITDAIHKKMKGTKVKPKDILLNITGGSIGRCALIPDDFDTANVSQHVAIVRMIELEMRGYIHQFIISPGFQDRIMDVQVGVSREGLSMTKLKMFPTPLPPLEEQKAIVKQVNRLLVLCDGLEEHIENSQTQIEQLMQSCLREVFENSN